MRGVVEIDRASGNIESKLSQVEDGASLSEASNEQVQEIGDSLTNILQDVNAYMRLSPEAGNFERMSLKLDSRHFVHIVASDSKIRAQLIEVETKWIIL